MNKLHLATMLIVVAIGSIIAMESDLEGNAPQGNTSLISRLKGKISLMRKLRAERNALESFRKDLNAAVDQAAEQLEKYAQDEPTIHLNNLLIYKFNPDSYMTADIPEDAVELLKVYANMMKDTYIAFANQFEDKENLVPISSRTYYTAEDYKNTYENLVEPYIAGQIERIEGEIEALE
jgi:hypothetical protein